MRCRGIKMNSFSPDIFSVWLERRVFYWIPKGWITPALYANFCEFFSVHFWLKCLSSDLEKIKMLGLYLLFSLMEASVTHSDLHDSLKIVHCKVHTIMQ